MLWLCYHRVPQATDRLYATQYLLSRKLRVEATVAPFTDISLYVYLYLMNYQLCGWNVGYEQKEQCRHNRERLHGEVQNSMGTPTTAEQIL